MIDWSGSAVGSQQVIICLGEVTSQDLYIGVSRKMLQGEEIHVFT